MTTAENAKIGTEMIMTAKINAAREVATILEAKAEEVTAETIMMAMVAAENAPSMDTRSIGTIGRVVSSTLIVAISMQTKQKSSSMRKHTDPTRSTRTYIRTALKRTGEAIITEGDAVTRAVEAVDVAAEAGVDTQADAATQADVVAEGGTKTKGTKTRVIRTKATSRGTVITTTTTSSKDITTTIITTMDRGGTSNKVPREDNIKAKGVANLLPRGEAKLWMDTTSITHSRSLREMSGQAQQDTWARGGTTLQRPVAGKTPSLRAPLKEPWTL